MYMEVWEGFSVRLLSQQRELLSIDAFAFTATNLLYAESLQGLKQGTLTAIQIFLE